MDEKKPRLNWGLKSRHVTMIAIMSIYPWNEVTANSSPFVQVFSGIGVVGAAGILNFVVLTAAISATNSYIFSTSRSLYCSHL